MSGNFQCWYLHTLILLAFIICGKPNRIQISESFHSIPFSFQRTLRMLTLAISHLKRTAVASQVSSIFSVSSYCNFIKVFGQGLPKLIFAQLSINSVLVEMEKKFHHGSGRPGINSWCHFFNIFGEKKMLGFFSREFCIHATLQKIPHTFCLWEDLRFVKVVEEHEKIRSSLSFLILH